MKEIKINDFSEKLYYEKLSNGFSIYLVPLKNKKDYHISMGVKYGNCYTSFKVNNKKYEVPSGIAHFLEHKLFEREDMPNPFLFFAKSGSDVNARTSILFTDYYCIGNEFFDYNLAYMLNWLQKIDISEEKIEKEKGIIIEEAKMHDDDPDRFLSERIKYNTFMKDPYGLKIIGEYSDIKNITKKDLDITFKAFYRPDNMFLVVTGNFDVDKTKQIIYEELNEWKNPEEEVFKIKAKELDFVRCDYEEFKMNVSIPKLGINYKINKKLFNLDNYNLSMYLAMILSLNFGGTSLFKETALNEELFTDFYYYVSLTEDYIIISFVASTLKAETLVKEIDKELKKIKVVEKDFERIKKCFIASEVKTIDSVNLLANSIFDDIINFNDYKTTTIKDMENLKLKTLNEILTNIDYSNKTILKILPIK